MKRHTARNIIKMLGGNFILLIIVFVKNFGSITSNDEILERDMNKNLETAIKESGFTEFEENDLLGILNKYRSRVFPSAGDMYKLVWNEELAKIAKKWSDQCLRENYKLKHCDKLTSLDYFITKKKVDAYKYIFFSWGENQNYYNHSLNTCRRNCDMYKTFVQAEYHSIGCSKSYCDESLSIITCNFYPRIRNVTVRPYRTGKHCSICELDEVCDKQLELCVKNDPHVPIEEFSKCERISVPTEIQTKSPSTHNSASGPIFTCANNTKLMIFILMEMIVLLSEFNFASSIYIVF